MIEIPQDIPELFPKGFTTTNREEGLFLVQINYLNNDDKSKTFLTFCVNHGLADAEAFFNVILKIISNLDNPMEIHQDRNTL